MRLYGPKHRGNGILSSDLGETETAATRRAYSLSIRHRQAWAYYAAGLGRKAQDGGAEWGLHDGATT
jgi:hypothetical protein